MPLPPLTSLRVSNHALKSEKLPSSLKIFNWGQNPSTKGTFTVGDKSASLLHSQQKSLGFERVAIDYNHCTVEGSPEYVKGQPKSIFGYGRPAVVPGDGIYLLDVTWTPEGEKHARNYEDLSPAAAATTGEVDFIHSVALTPNGCLHDITFFSSHTPTLPHSNTPMQPIPITLTILAAALNLKPEATEAEVTAKIKKLSALEPLEALLKDNKIVVLDTVTDLSTRLTAAETALKAQIKNQNSKIENFSATVDGKVITLSTEDLIKLSSRIDSIETGIKTQLDQSTNAEKSNLIVLFATDGKAPLNPDTRKAYTSDELRTLDVKTLRLLHANTPSTVPLAARSRVPIEGQTRDPKLKGMARFTAAQDEENRRTIRN